MCWLYEWFSKYSSWNSTISITWEMQILGPILDLMIQDNLGLDPGDKFYKYNGWFQHIILRIPGRNWF